MEKGEVKKEKVSYEDNLQLIPLAKEGNTEALNKLIEANLPLVTSISKKFTNRGYEYEDIYQIGCMGLVKAIKNFDEKYNVKFSTYAVPMIIGEIKRFLRDDGMIKVSRNVKSLAKKLHFDKEALTKELNREPTVEELAQFSGMDKEEILFALESSASMQYLYEVIHQDDGSPVLLIDKLSENAIEDKNITEKLALKEALRNLDTKSRQIIVLRYFKDKTQIQVAKNVGNKSSASIKDRKKGITRNEKTIR